MNYANVPAELRERRQWVVWKLELKPGRDKPTKVPYNARGFAKSTSPDTWMTFAEAEALAREKGFNGIGFVFTKHDPYVGVDLDHTIINGKLSLWGEDIIRMLSPAYIEISQSGEGIHLIVQGKLPPGSRRKDFEDHGVKAGIEAYEEGRYFAITGNVFAGSAATIPEQTTALATFHAKYMSDGTALESIPIDQPVTPTAPEVVADATAAILTKIDSSPDARFFTTLYEFGETRPGKSPSESDMAMAACLAKYTRDAALIESIMKSSALKRPKWNESRPMPGRKDGTILRRVIAAALRQTPDHIATSEATFSAIDDEELVKLPDPEWIIQGVIPSDSGVLLYGRRSSYKSFVLLDWMLSIQAGIEWHHHETVQGQCVYIAAEGWGGLKKRVHAWKQAHGIKDRIGFIIIHGKTLRSNSAIDSLIGAIRAATKDHIPTMIGLDTLNRLLPGIEENTPEAMGQAVGIADRLRSAFPRSAVVWVHHSGWEDQHERGHSSLGDDLDTVIHVEKETEQYATKLVCNKQKDADEFYPINISLKLEGEAGTPLASLVVSSAQSISVAPSPEMTEIEQAAYDILASVSDGLGPKACFNLLKESGYFTTHRETGFESFRNTIGSLKAKHRIERKEGTSGAGTRYVIVEIPPLPDSPNESVPVITVSGATV